MCDVLREGRGRREAERLFPDLDIDAQPAQAFVQADVEVGDRSSGFEAEGFRPTIGGPHDERVVDEVDDDLESRAAMVHAPRGETADVDVQRDVPPMVARRRRSQSDLADDLAVQMQRVLRGTPAVEVQLREGHPVAITNAVLSGQQAPPSVWR